MPRRPTFDVLISDTGAGVLVHLEGELDVETASRFLEALRGSPTGEGREVELDLSGLTFLDVAGVRALVRVHDQMTSDGGRVRCAVWTRPGCRRRASSVWAGTSTPAPPGGTRDR